MKLFDFYYDKKHFIFNILGLKLSLHHAVSERLANAENKVETYEYILSKFVKITNCEPADDSLREAQLELTGILKYIDETCKKNQLQYWLDSGTLLGAIRHKGFIPWDDDIDICMLRDDYEKITQILKDELQNNENWVLRERADSCNNLQLRIMSKKFEQNVGLDIFPVNKYFKSNLSEEEKILATLDIKEATKMFNKSFPEKFYEKSEICKMKACINDITNEIIMKNHSIEKDKPALYYSIEFASDAKSLVIDYDTVFPLKTIEFEGNLYMCPNNVNKYLKNYYNDYMSFPSKIENDSGLKKNSRACPPPVERLIYSYISALLTNNDLNLLHLIFNQKPTQEMLDEFLKTYDIEVAGGYKALMLSYFMRMYPELNFTKYENQRLKGLFNFYRFQNMKLLSYFIKIGKALNQNNIPILVLKGFAMKCLRPELSRAMGDIDILVPENKFVKTIKLVKNMGYRLDVVVHSIDVHEPDSDAGIMDIHRYIDMKNRKERPLNKFLFKRAKETSFNGIKILIPSNEDLLFLSLINLALNLKCKTSKASTLYVLFDCKYLLEKSGFNFNIVINNTKLTHTQNEIAHAVKFINTIVPNLIPPQLSIPFEKYVNNSCVEILFNNRYFPALQKIARRTKFKQVQNHNMKFSNYLKLKSHYKFCKFINNKKMYKVKAYILQAREREKQCS